MESKENVWERLGKPKYVLAPMVEQSELPWRMLSRKHGVQLCFAPMLHSQNFVQDRKYRKEFFTTCPEDRPLVVQFCGNDPKVILEAGKLVEDSCDVIDLNLGCPQAIAKRGFYGSFLQDEWKLIFDIVKTLRDNLKVPVSCKIRIFEDLTKTISYAKMLEEAGCQMLSVHGRTRDQKGRLTGIADWSQIKAVKENVTIPVLANGNILIYQDIERCLKDTLCEGVMSAEGHLHNPYIFDNQSPPVWEPALEYLDLSQQYPCPLSNTRGHLFKLCYHVFSLPENESIRDILAKGQNRNDFRNAIMQLKVKYLPYHMGQLPWNSNQNDYNLTLPPWLCQPMVRVIQKSNLVELETNEEVNKSKTDEKENLKRGIDDEDCIDPLKLSKKKLKQLSKLKNKEIRCQRILEELCSECKNPKGLKCEYKLCKKCCRSKCYLEIADCLGHRILIKTKKKLSRHKEEKDLSSKQIYTDVS
ncbi:tRNA-dihydrouridine(16/17) synthase [NAD(P)(+)]-like [Acyrthosiphon pisum]|uniref:tRNA-dihydrouridine(16/17) synthase [NAD(P)(+)] n=1 Tax=Acyrthosiphon pisum TaxID=7029 RepID=A0A8R2AE45_ACYPI|nr:tRNA-dihydrouridine(16/17) synthase [NAD(P)(+)]-like [Acyrthosiphon pisum]XP_008188305.1 tRNA-dihydrouridine(16/17) synthase [NAD(P)(+)]-like [Acyrthosiphon pisum]XP_008188306.1 tRNA-dihydrouridine(16/17) synthase [NAD(P)(+)]-like [Acyrthosiphon pisum]|eukprot:XP_001951016.1 PREDICTED: tRNA-dihydrouridine(16/17) synthase [NAD(P)(+)]-like [Acyrthosiphon pisum]